MMASQLNQVSSAEGQYYFIANITGAWYGNGVQQVKDINTPNTKLMRFFAFPVLSGGQQSAEWMESCLQNCPALCSRGPGR
ncbi:hypothetical protein IV203_023222 [Nitzschia inconspicua]|uniref:Uncharacterized protein n=1 Tax=Nitzschia inconspicua TaxID=303405 RepID=A0A9K3KD86_9STRA|nr:hypothetical protein IV203_023222 [Nitzschia inconspicua]